MVAYKKKGKLLLFEMNIKVISGDTSHSVACKSMTIFCFFLIYLLVQGILHCEFLFRLLCPLPQRETKLPLNI